MLEKIFFHLWRLNVQRIKVQVHKRPGALSATPKRLCLKILDRIFLEHKPQVGDTMT